MKIRVLAGLAALLMAAGQPALAQSRDQVRLGLLASLTDAPIFIAIKKGFYAEENIEVALTTFRSGANMVLPLGTGELDAAAGSPSAGLYNAIARGVKMRIVADKTRSTPGFGGSHFIVRKDLVESGRFKTLKDLKGMKIAMNGPGISNTATLHYLLTANGLTQADVSTVDLNFPDHIAAFANKSVDAANNLEPFISLAVARGLAVRIISDDQIDPNHQLANILFSDAFSGKRDVAVRFLRAYLKGARVYIKALKDGKLAGETAEEVIAILTEFTAVKDANVLRGITPSGIDPDGEVNAASLQKDLDFYRTQDQIKGEVDLQKIIDPSFVREAAKSLGPFK